MIGYFPQGLFSIFCEHPVVNLGFTGGHRGHLGAYSDPDIWSIWSKIVYLLKNDDLLLKMCTQHMVSEIKMMIAFILIISQISTSFWGTPGVKWGSKWGQKDQKLPVCLKIMTDCWKCVHNILLAM